MFVRIDDGDMNHSPEDVMLMLKMLQLDRLLNSSSAAHQELHAFPTRRSSDLVRARDRARRRLHRARRRLHLRRRAGRPPRRSEEHTSELQSRRDLVCRLLLEKKKLILNMLQLERALTSNSAALTELVAGLIEV